MKKTLLYLAGAAALLVGCAKEVSVEEPTPTPGAKTITIQASIDPETRTTVEINNGKGVYSWEEEEKISVLEHSSTGDNKLKVFTVSDAANGLFTGELLEGYEIIGAFSLTNMVGGGGLYDDGLRCLLYMEGNYPYGSTNAYMVAGAPTVSEGMNKFSFKHIAALFKVTYENVPVGTKQLSITTDQPMAWIGDLSLTSFENAEITTSMMPSDAQKTIKVTLKEAVTVPNQTLTFYAPIPTGTYGSVAVALLDASGNTLAGTEKSKTASFTVERGMIVELPTITLNPAELYYVKVTSNEEIVAGDYLIVYETLDNNLDDVAMILSGVDNKIGTVASSAIILDGDRKKIAQENNEAYNIVVEEGNGGYTMKLGDAYLAYTFAEGTSSNNNLFLVEDVMTDGAEWTLSVDEGIQNVYNPERYLQYNLSSPRFACYTGSQQDVSLYLLEGSGHSSGKQNVSLSFDPASVELTLGGTFTKPTLTTNPTGLTVTYASDNEEVATVDETTGEVTILAVGTATITATFVGNDQYKAGSASYTITVDPVKDYFFYESFDQCAGLGGNDGDWNTTGNTNIVADNSGWTFERGNGAKNCAKFGTGKVAGYAITPALGITSETATLTFKAAPWAGDATTLNISIEGNGLVSVSSVTMTSGSFTEYTVILGDGIDASTKIKFAAAQTNNNRFFLDEVKVVAGGEMPVIKQDPVMTFDQVSVELTLGDTFNSPTLSTEPAGLEVTYASSNTNVATVNSSTGAVTIKAVGNATITASFAGNDAYNAGTASYTIKVVEPASTIAAILAGGAGYNKRVDNVTVLATSGVHYVIGDGTGVIRMYYPTSSSSPKKDDVISITGNVTIYEGVYQFSNVTVSDGTGSAAEYGDPVVFDESAFAAWRNTSVPRETKYVTFSGMVPDSSGSPMMLGSEKINIIGDLTGYYGTNAVLTGYIIGYDNIFRFLLTDIEIDVNAPAISIDPATTSSSPASWPADNDDTKSFAITASNGTWQITDDTTVSDWANIVTNGNNISVTPKAKRATDAHSGSITITLTPSNSIYSEQTATIYLAQAKYGQSGGTIVFDLGKSTTGSNSSSYVETATEFTVQNVSFKVNNWNPSTGQVRGNQGTATSINAKNFQLYNTTAIPGKIRSITFESTNVIATYTFSAFGTTALSSVSVSDANPESVTDGVKWEVSGDNSFFYISMAKGGTTGTAKITKVTIVYE